ncbi:carboxy terminal-processing peptidase [Oleiagrimonas sp.]|jgi:carboxyl-terminal processing protease|uniref:carboxy terminal-processing peptidase n=1 Tax=Oleiagrimonas sp. TaxID=2010330 RepID=UPI0026256C22|nr:carboxy terminal-processing peptidase [Oleiagrimonas sp.]MDA3914289.1 carboxy terminal-processing peptidase [Oleiagrimonas sp.]
MFKRLFFVLLVGALTGVAVHASAPAKSDSLTLKPTSTEAQAAALSARFLTRFQYDAKPLDNAMSQKIFKAYFKALDGNKLYFTKKDIDHFSSLRDGLDNAIWDQNLSGPFAIFNLYIQRATQHLNYARSLLKKGFDFSKQESYDYDRDKAQWAPNEKALDALWRKRVKNDWLRLKLAGKDDATIRKVLDKRYKGYIDRIDQLDSQDAFQTFLNAYAETTDPHTDYFGPRAAKNFDIEMKLSLEGIGAVLQANDEYTMVREVVPGGPASKSGKIHVGDRIVGVGQGAKGPITDVIGWRLDDVVDKIRGKKNTTLRLEIIPGKTGLDGKHKIITLVRKKVTIAEQAAKKKVIQVTSKNGKVTRRIGVIELPSFYEDFAARSAGDPNYKSATRDVAKLIGQLKKEKVDGIIVDLRNNGGGSLSEAVSMTGLFINTGPVVQVRSSNGSVDEQDDTTKGMSWSGPLAVLVNRGTASASEIFAAAIQDYGRGLIIGEPTFGKGTVQNLVNLDRFSQSEKNPQYGELKMTIAKFFRITGGATQLRGVTPDIAFPKNGDEKLFGESTYDNALPWTHIQPAQYKPVANLKMLVPMLEQRHLKRIADSAGWKLMMDEMHTYEKNRNKTTVSLNYAKRLAERKHVEAVQKAFRKRHQKINGDKTDTEEVTLDDGLTPGERSITAQIKQQKEADKATDEMLDEAAHIVSDEVGLIHTDTKLASQVLPYHGKKIGATD